MGRSLAGEIGQEKHPARTGLRFFCLRDEQFIRIALFPLGLADLSHAQRITQPLKAPARRHHAAEHAPLAIHARTKRIHATFRVHPIGFAVRVDHAAGAHHRTGEPFTNDAIAHRPDRLIAAARCDRRAGHEPQRVRCRLGQATRHLVRLDHRRENLRVQLEQRDDLFAPGALFLIEHQRPRHVRHIARILAGQLQPDVILGQQQMTNAIINAGLVLADPQKLRERKTGHGCIADHVDELFLPASRLLDHRRLRACALVVPDDTGAQRLARVVGNHESMHLATQAYALDARGFDARFFHDRFGRLDRASPPVFGALFTVAGLGSQAAIFCGGGGNDLALARHHQNLRAARTNVDAQIMCHDVSFGGGVFVKFKPH